MSVHWEVEIISRSSGTWISPFLPTGEEEALELMAQLKCSKRLVKVDTVRKVEAQVEKERPH
jgi:hypothetical protein